MVLLYRGDIMNKTFKKFTFGHGAVLRNRLVLAPMTTYSSNDDLTLSKEEEVYYKSRSKGMGMVITAATAINKNAQAFENQITARDERYLDSMKRLSNAIKSEGALSILQLHHGGRMNVPGLYANQDIVCPSCVKANRDYAVEPRELKTSEVYDIIDDFVRSAKIAIKAGFDGIELHGANTYLLQQFFSPNSNQRDDEFGGSLEKRMKFGLILVKRMIELKKKYAKKEFIIGYRFSPEELENPGITLKDTLEFVDELASKDIDYLHVSLGNFNATSVRDKTDKELIVKKLQSVINKRVPLIGVGHLESLNDLDEAFSLGYNLLALGLIALSDMNVVENLENNLEPNKVFRRKDLLPTNMYNRLENWGAGLKDRGYTFE
jgi:2,4-dienoyl-CoA reductase-like NADH-dependent reductase (Old Yellow Enzyme family)